MVAGPAPSGSAAAAYANDDLLAPGQVHLMAPSPLQGRSTAASVWTGAEMLVWGGEGGGGFLDDGAGYDPRGDSWRTLPPGPLSARNAPAAVWTGTEMIQWGGHSRGVDHADGAVFDPVEGTWRSTADAPIRSAGGPTAVWNRHRDGGRGRLQRDVGGGLRSEP